MMMIDTSLLFEVDMSRYPSSGVEIICPWKQLEMRVRLWQAGGLAGCLRLNRPLPAGELLWGPLERQHSWQAVPTFTLDPC